MASIFSIEVEDVTCEHGMDMYCAAYIHVEHLILSDLMYLLLIYNMLLARYVFIYMYTVIKSAEE